MKFVIYRDKGGKSRWKLVAKNGQNVANGSEGYNSPGNARRAIKTFLQQVHAAKVEEEKAHVAPDAEA